MCDEVDLDRGVFLSTPSGWRATTRRGSSRMSRRISIHALRVEGDSACVSASCKARLFLSTPSGWRATTFRAAQGHRTPISIHALRVEGDAFDSIRHLLHPFDFYPRPPGGGRPVVSGINILRGAFLSTPSGWRATRLGCRLCRCARFLSTPSGWRATGRTCHVFVAQSVISIHALRVEGDKLEDRRKHLVDHFYPRPPGGGRPVYPTRVGRACDFYPRPPGGGRRRLCDLQFLIFQFLSTPSGWRATVVHVTYLLRNR